MNSSSWYLTRLLSCTSRVSPSWYILSSLFRRGPSSLKSILRWMQIEFLLILVLITLSSNFVRVIVYCSEQQEQEDWIWLVVRAAVEDIVDGFDTVDGFSLLFGLLSHPELYYCPHPFICRCAGFVFVVLLFGLLSHSEYKTRTNIVIRFSDAALLTF